MKFEEVLAVKST